MKPLSLSEFILMDIVRSGASRLEHQLLICPRSNSGAPTDPSLFNLEKYLADELRERAVNTLKSDLTFFQQLDSGILRSLCEKEKGSFYKSFSDQLENMLKYDEYAGVPEIIGLVYGASCPLYIYNESNGNYVCGMKYGDDTFPNVEPIRLLYSPDTHDPPGHYDLLVSQHTITASHAITDTAISPCSIFDTRRNLWRLSCCQDEPNFDTVFNDRNDSHSFACTDEAVKPTHSVNLVRTLSEAKLDFSLPDKCSISTPVPAIDCSPARLFADLTLNDFSITDSEKASTEKLQVLCERNDIQCTLLSKKDNSKLFCPH